MTNNLYQLFNITTNILKTGLPLFNAKTVLTNYQASDFENYIFPYSDKYHYCNRVFENNYCSLWILTWIKNQSSGFHIHDKDSLFKILDGRLQELIVPTQSNVPFTNILNKNEVYSRPKNFGKHKIFHNHDYRTAVSLHIYDERRNPIIIK